MRKNDIASMYLTLLICISLSLSLFLSADNTNAQLQRKEKQLPTTRSKTVPKVQTSPTEQTTPKEQGPSVSITITKPDAATGWCVGSTQTITWQSTLPASTSLKIDLLGSDKNLFKQLTNNTPNSGSYSWTISPSQFSFQQGSFYVQISTIDGTVLGISPRFSVGRELFLSNPQSQQTWRKGSYYDIRWFQGCVTNATQLKVELLNANKELVTTLSAAVLIRSSPNNDGNYLRWTVPTDTPSGTYWIRITTADGQFMSESSFKIEDQLVQGPISNGITVTKPDATTGWCVGSTQTITWQSTLPASTSLKIDVLNSMRQQFRQLTNNTPNSGSYSWTISPSQFSSQQGYHHVRVSTQDGSSFGESDRFSVGRELFLSNPQSQQTWRKGSYYDIRWFQGCVTNATQLKVELLNANKELVTTLSAAVPIRSSPNNDGNYLGWTVPTDTPSGTYWIRITTADGQFMSESSFKIADP